MSVCTKKTKPWQAMGHQHGHQQVADDDDDDGLLLSL
jgi:hypothetical protein